jgi:hypothetical protein
LLVLRIGTVEILTKRLPNLSGVSSHGCLILNEVLHIPDFLCNVVGSPINSSDGYVVEISSSSKSKETIKDSQGKNMTYFDINWPLFAVKVRGQVMGIDNGRNVAIRFVVLANEVLSTRGERCD